LLGLHLWSVELICVLSCRVLRPGVSTMISMHGDAEQTSKYFCSPLLFDVLVALVASTKRVHLQRTDSPAA
jgi:hypothetical protein